MNITACSAVLELKKAFFISFRLVYLPQGVGTHFYLQIGGLIDPFDILVSFIASRIS
jgi:hypothetical protein